MFYYCWCCIFFSFFYFSFFLFFNFFSLIQTLKGHISEINSLVFNKDGSWLLSGSYDGTLIAWDTKTFERIRTISSSGKSREKDVLWFRCTFESHFATSCSEHYPSEHRLPHCAIVETTHRNELCHLICSKW